jgi:hypothetical protein
LIIGCQDKSFDKITQQMNEDELRDLDDYSGAVDKTD